MPPTDRHVGHGNIHTEIFHHLDPLPAHAALLAPRNGQPALRFDRETVFKALFGRGLLKPEDIERAQFIGDFERAAHSEAVVAIHEQIDSWANRFPHRPHAGDSHGSVFGAVRNGQAVKRSQLDRVESPRHRGFGIFGKSTGRAVLSSPC